MTIWLSILEKYFEATHIKELYFQQGVSLKILLTGSKSPEGQDVCKSL